MIVLTSSGLNSEKLILEMQKYISKTMKKAVIITTASDYKEDDRHIPRIKCELEALNLHVNFFDIEFQDPNELHEYDVVLLNGGNPFKLLYFLRKKNCKIIFEKLLEQDKVIIGISAGSLVLGETCGMVYEFDPEMNDNINLQDFEGLKLTKLNICPHYSRFINKYDRFSERVDEYQEKASIEIIKIEDGEAIFEVGNSYFKI